ncbi:rRNA maturation RNase YbeY [Fictibacillus sp. KIGAM418]|uniref:Endoribonuclease YbeY n=1 Tax=Fictibacillus marinisediminis TaxID=2878389 RepID=A0A9X1XBB5_9BACL|nr:rRNA maturation RNase YbeY [Fictibacillus marinisediminis]MCK6257752.1 rRNA maturation RNase YbeY [Fictibacillus marinisediminis]
MSLHIDFTDETEQISPAQIEELTNLLNQAAVMEDIPNETELSVTFVTNERIHEINKQYRNKDTPTDVISFAMEEMGEGELEIIGDDLPRILGDIIISAEIAKNQAEEYGHSFLRELGFLTVHGFLHLLGYDHLNEHEEKKMFSRQDEILNEYGLTR